MQFYAVLANTVIHQIKYRLHFKLISQEKAIFIKAD